MFGRNLFPAFNEDPFFRTHNEAMQHMMNDIHNPVYQRNFAIMPEPNRIAGRENVRNGQYRNDMLAPIDMFSHMNSIFSNMDSMFANMQQHFAAPANDGNVHSYSSSTVMSYSNNGREEPKYFQATTSTRRAPGGVKETKNSLRDSVTGVHKIAVQQHIGDKGHMYERSENARTGNTEEKREFYNMLDEDAEKFDREWRSRTRRQDGAIGYERKHKHNKHPPNRLRAVQGKRVDFDESARKRPGDRS